MPPEGNLNKRSLENQGSRSLSMRSHSRELVCRSMAVSSRRAVVPVNATKGPAWSLVPVGPNGQGAAARYENVVGRGRQVGSAGSSEVGWNEKPSDKALAPKCWHWRC